MATRVLKVLYVSAEVAPYSTVGGLAQVSFYLPKALRKLGVDVRIFTPKYGSINPTLLSLSEVIEGLKVPTNEPKDSQHPQHLICNIKKQKVTKKEDVPVYFLENMEYYEKRANVYGYLDDHIRFGLLSRAALEFASHNEFVPDIIHSNDWHTAYVPNFARTAYIGDPIIEHMSFLLSVHNLFQGIFDFDHASEMDFDDGKGPLASYFSDRFFKQNALKRGIIHSDLINTVSQTYSREIMTEEYGYRLHNLFKELRGKMYGVLNGLDYNNFNPKTDKIIKRNYSAKNISLRDENKIDLQREFNLDIEPNTPILAISGRLDSQKGLDLIVETIDFILQELKVQLVVLGGGDDRYRDFFIALEKKYPKRVGTHLMYDGSLPRKIFAGADMILMPSKYEPGGIVALEAMRYGCVPVVRETGGLADSVIDYDPAQSIGTGFTFQKFSSMSLLVTLVRALETYRKKPEWKRIVKRAMEQDFSWDKSAKKYLDLYHRAQDMKH
jgi:starch synthase